MVVLYNNNVCSHPQNMFCYILRAIKQDYLSANKSMHEYRMYRIVLVHFSWGKNKLLLLEGRQNLSVSKQIWVHERVFALINQSLLT